jgi:hypothetical protein
MATVLKLGKYLNKMWLATITNMQTTIALYLLAGVAANFIWDLLVDNLVKTTELEEAELRFSWWERFIVTLLWPLATLVFIYNFIKGATK